MQVTIELLWQTQPLVFDKVQDTYQRGEMFCVQLMDGTIHKFPFRNIYHVTEYSAVGMPTMPGRK